MPHPKTHLFVSCIVLLADYVFKYCGVIEVLLDRVMELGSSSWWPAQGLTRLPGRYRMPTQEETDLVRCAHAGFPSVRDGSDENGVAGEA